jgi:Tol biopolymer transport system component/tRNA A-37 threonylcarbamoyl transferase component Bud32
LLSGHAVGDLAERLQRALGVGYEVTDDLGGGMARVFVVREVALGRDIVVKVLPPELGAGLNIDRFRREIQLAARLQHPHIVPLLFAGSNDDLLYYAMPLVEGETLRSRLKRAGELPIAETVRIMQDIADALTYAHKQGAAHRDIKPDNILLSGNHALLTDFGIAKAVEDAGDIELTAVGVAIGTPAYMAPEQAMGSPMTDQRADIYAIGVVGYEMLAGMTPFFGNTPQQLMTAHMSAVAPPITKYRPNVPPSLAAVIMRCLEKRPADRFQTARELCEQLEAAITPTGGTITSVTAETVGATASTPSPGEQVAAPKGETAPMPSLTTLETQRVRSGATGPTAGATRSPWRRRRVLVLAGIVTVLLVGSLIASRYLTGGEPQFEVGSTRQLTNDLGLEITPAFSPDGRMIAYAAGRPGNTNIMVRHIGGGDAIRLASGLTPQWSPDGSRLVYSDTAGIAALPVLGGTPQRLVRNPEKEYSVSPVWSHDGKRLAYAQVRTIGGFGSIWIANADGSSPRKIRDANEPHGLAWSPDDDRLAFVEGNLLYVYSAVQFGNIAPSRVWVIDSDGKNAVQLTDSLKQSVSPAWSVDGDGVFYVSNARGGRDLYYQRVNGTRADGLPQRLTSGLKIHGIASTGEGRGGDRIAYSAWTTNVGIWSLPFPRRGAVSVATAHSIMSTTESIEVVRLSPDGQWLAFDSDRSGNMDIYKMRVDGTGLQQLTTNPADDFRPSWSPDGNEIAFHSWRSGSRDSYVVAADGSAERVIASGPAHEFSGTWSPDGKQIAFESDRTGQIEIYVAPSTGGTPRRLTTGGGSLPRWSPDGKFIAFTITATNTPGVAPEAPLRVIPVEGGAVRAIPLPASFGQMAAIEGWSSDGRKLYFRVIAPNGERNIAEAPIDGSAPTTLVKFDDPERLPFNPFFTTDGKTIYFTLGRHEADIWVMDLNRK